MSWYGLIGKIVLAIAPATTPARIVVIAVFGASKRSIDHQRSGGKRSGKGSCQSCACACGKELFAFAAQDMSPFADQVTYVGTHLYGRPLASHRETAAECQHTTRKLSQQLAKGMCILDASIDNAPCLRNASASDVSPPSGHPGDEAEDTP